MRRPWPTRGCQAMEKKSDNKRTYAASCKTNSLPLGQVILEEDGTTML
jgi:hypothetical protein